MEGSDADCCSCVRRDCKAASCRNLWVATADEARGGLRAIEHRGRRGTTIHTRLSQVHIYRNGFSRGAGYTAPALRSPETTGLQRCAEGGYKKESSDVVASTSISPPAGPPFMSCLRRHVVTPSRRHSLEAGAGLCR